MAILKFPAQKAWEKWEPFRYFMPHRGVSGMKEIFLTHACLRKLKFSFFFFLPQDRRAELEALDLAVEKQKASLASVKEAEKILLAEREAARVQLTALKLSNAEKDARTRFAFFPLPI